MWHYNYGPYLEHGFKYIKRYKVDGKWRYVYADKQGHNQAQRKVNVSNYTANKYEKEKDNEERAHKNFKASLDYAYNSSKNADETTARYGMTTESARKKSEEYADKYIEAQNNRWNAYDKAKEARETAIDHFDNNDIKASAKRLIEKLKKKKK